MGKQKFYWQVINEGVAVRWATWTEDGREHYDGPVGMIVYGLVDFDLLRSVPLSRLQPHVEGWPEIDGAKVPTEAQVEKAWRSTYRQRMDEKKWDLFQLTFPPRMESETPDRFYRRVGDFYRLATVKTGEPTKALAEAADVPKTTAARWIRQARDRGFLSPTTKGRRSR